MNPWQQFVRGELRPQKIWVATAAAPGLCWSTRRPRLWAPTFLIWRSLGTPGAPKGSAFSGCFPDLIPRTAWKPLEREGHMWLIWAAKLDQPAAFARWLGGVHAETGRLSSYFTTAEIRTDKNIKTSSGMSKWHKTIRARTSKAIEIHWTYPFGVSTQLVQHDNQKYPGPPGKKRI